MQKKDKTQAFEKFLAAGKTTAVAAACAGIPPDEVDEELRKIIATRKNDSLPLSIAAFDKVMSAVEALDEVLRHTEDDRARVSAAKAILDFALQSQKLRSGVEILSRAATGGDVGPVLWDFS